VYKKNSQKVGECLLRKYIRGFISLFLSLSIILIPGCVSKEEKNKLEKPRNLTINLNESFQSFVERYPSVRKTQPLGEKGGATFYKFYWSEEEPASISINYGSGEVKIDNVINFSMLESDHKSKEGITHTSFDAGITYDKTISHDDARLQFHDFLQRLLNQDWKRTLYYGYPRLIGSQAMHYMREKRSAYPLDPSYLPTLKEWNAMKKGGTRWELNIENKAFMSISLQRKDNQTNPDMGVYLLSIEIKNDQEMGRAHFSPENKTDWNDQEKWNAAKKMFLRKREKTEKDLISKGYKIDESYEDYEINPKTSQ